MVCLLPPTFQPPSWSGFSRMWRRWDDFWLWTTVLYIRLRMLQRQVSWCLAQLTPGWSGTSPVDSRAEGGSFYLFEVQEYISSMMGRHVTDVTNASRTMLMDIASLQWSQELLDFFKLPSGIHLPKIQVQMKPHIYLILFSGVLLKFWKFGWWSLEGSRYFRSCRRPTGSWSCLRPLPMSGFLSAKHIVFGILLCSRQHFWVRAVWAVERRRTPMGQVSFSSWG